jgi:DNA-directed RNA polymerase II subunit RPB2
VIEVIERCDTLIPLSEFSGVNNITKVFVNGILVGMTDDNDDLLDEIKAFRTSKILPYDISISYNDIDDEFHIYSDEGRLLRPVFIVENDTVKAKEKDGTCWDTLVDKDLIRYVDNNEISNAVVAFYQTELKKYKNDYCEIAPAMMLGVMASIIPFPDHSQSPRNCYQAAMGKQAMSMYALSHLVRTDTVTHVLTYPQKPLVSTKPANMMGFDKMPSGINAVVAIACYKGYNQEDSVILNKGAIDRGLFWATTYRTHSEVEKKRGTYNFEHIGTPPLDKRRPDVNYSLLDEHGVVRSRHRVYTDENGKKTGGGSVYVQKGDVIIGKIIVKSNKSGSEELTDNSLVIKKGEEGYIDRVHVSTTPDGYKLVKVVIRKVRIPEVGDKFASRSAQKGTCGLVCAQENMPWTTDGITPDIIMNPHAMPSRMTINQLMESVLGKSACMDGKFGDATPFTSSSVGIAETLCERLGMNKFEKSGKEMLYNGETGELLGQVFIGTVYYQRLKHLVDDKMHARAQGPNATLTRQPLEGRSRDGGLRFGEMERDCMISHGASRFLKERLCDQSDPYTATICNTCGNFSTSADYCKSCDTDCISRVNLPYVSKLVIQELNAMLIKCKISA